MNKDYTNIVKVVGGTCDFVDFLQKCDESISYEFHETIHNAIKENSECRAYIFLPDYKNDEYSIPQVNFDDIALLSLLKSKKQKIFAENYLSYNFHQASVFGYEIVGEQNHINTETIITDGKLIASLQGERIMQARNYKYINSIERFKNGHKANTPIDCEVLLRVGDYVGTTKPINESQNTVPVLYRSSTIYASLLCMTDVNRYFMLPNYRWKKVFCTVFSDVLGIDTDRIERSFIRKWQPVQTRNKCDSRIPSNARNESIDTAIIDSVIWHENSGMICDKEGINGSFEMIMSSNFNIYANKRVDAGLYTGLLLTMAGDHLNNLAWYTKGKNIVDYFMNDNQIEGGIYDGLYKWYLNQGVGPWTIFSIDSGRCGIALINMYRITNDDKYLRSAISLGDGFLRWISDNLLSSASCKYGNTSDVTTFVKRPGVKTPAIYGEVAIFLTMLAKLTHDSKYIVATINISEELRKSFPDYEYYGHTTSSRYARYLMILLSVQQSGMKDYSHDINNIIEYFSGIQLECGGIFAEDNLSFFDNHGSHENGINTYWETDKISDQLYCVNNALAAFSMMKKLSVIGEINKAKGEKIFNDLIDYVVKIQITDDDDRLRGGWMRSYDITHNEYYGLNLDMFWGPYCIMSGWIMGMIPLALLTAKGYFCPYIID